MFSLLLVERTLLLFRNRGNKSGTRLLLISRQGDQWMAVDPEWSRNDWYPINQIVTIPWPIFIFVDEESITDFIHSDKHNVESLRSYVILMRGIECQAFVMTAAELARELNGKPVKFFRSSDPVDLVRQSVNRAGKAFLDTTKGNLAVMSSADISSAESIFDLHGNTLKKTFASASSYWALQRLLWRSTVRKCRTVEGFMQSDPVSGQADDLQLMVSQRAHRKNGPIAMMLGKGRSRKTILSYGSNFVNEDLGSQNMSIVMFAEPPKLNPLVENFEHTTAGMVPHSRIPFDVLAAIS